MSYPPTLTNVSLQQPERPDLNVDVSRLFGFPDCMERVSTGALELGSGSFRQEILGCPAPRTNPEGEEHGLDVGPPLGLLWRSVARREPELRPPSCRVQGGHLLPEA